jgi:hypothetical protein
MKSPSEPLDLDEFEAIEWDSIDDASGNLRHCMEHDVTEWVVEEVLDGDWISIELEVDSAIYAVCGPQADGTTMWTLLFVPSDRRGDWLRPITGWEAKPSETREWERATGRSWKGRWKYDG